MMKKHRASGFTILELTIVVIIIALVSGMGLMATIGAVESARRAATENKLNEIEAALMRYREIYDRLPCPADITVPDTDDDVGEATTPTGDCTNGGVDPQARLWTVGVNEVVEGAVPVKALNLPDDFMYDGWDRRILYTVNATFTSEKSFTYMHPKEQCGTDIYGVNSGVTKSTNAIYALISHGENGHGAYISSGSRITDSSADGNELKNCRCTAVGADAASFTGTVQKPYSQNAGGGLVFDDIVRFKERWQMQTPEDDKQYGEYRDTQLLIAFTNALSIPFYYEKQCDLWRNPLSTATNYFATMINSAVSLFTFTPDNEYVYAYHDQFSGVDCSMATMKGVTPGTVNIVTPNCPAYAAGNAATMSANGYLGISFDDGTPKFRMWKYAKNTSSITDITRANPAVVTVEDADLFSDGDIVTIVGVAGMTEVNNVDFEVANLDANANTFELDSTDSSGYTGYPAIGGGGTVKSGKFVELATVVDATNIPSKPTIAVFSPNANHLFLANPGNWATVFRRTDANQLVPLAITIPDNDVVAAAYSKDGRFFAVSYDDGTTDMTVYKIDSGNNYTSISTLDTGGADTLDDGVGSHVSAIAFSPDGNYIAVGGEGDSANISDNIAIYKINETGAGTVSFSPVTITGTYDSYTSAGEIVALKFTRDSYYLLSGENNSSGLSSFAILKREGATDFSYKGTVENGYVGRAPKVFGVIH
ncbi:MAG: ubiquitin-activating E1 FCCH domain-containing protein [Rickettsiales bacterium]